MVSPREWLPIVGSSGDQTIIDQKSVDEWDLEARNVDTELNILENEITQVDNEFRSLIQEAAEAPETQRPRLKRKAKQKQNEKEQKEDTYHRKLTEYGTLLTIKNAKKRLQKENKSSLHELSSGEIQEVGQTLKSDLNKENQSHERIEKLNQTIDSTLTALSDSNEIQQEDELDQLIDAVAEGEKDINEVDASMSSSTNGSEKSLE